MTVTDDESHITLYVKDQFWVLTITEFNELFETMMDIKGANSIPKGELFSALTVDFPTGEE